MTVYKTTTAQLVKKPIQYIEETIEGTIPTVGSTAAVGPSASIALKKGGNWVEVPQLAAEDLVGLVQGQQKFDIQIKYTLADSKFLKYFVNAANYATPTGTVSSSLSIVFSIYYNGVENYIVMTGCRANSVTIDGEIGKPISVTCTLIGMNIVAPSSSAPTGLTFVTSVPSGPVWDWLSGGAKPFAYASIGQDCKKYSITISRTAKEDYIIGAINPSSTQPHGRRIGITADFLWDGLSTLEADFTTPTSATVAITIKTSTSTITFTGFQVTDYSRDTDIGSDMAIVESISAKALSVVVT